MLKVIVKIPKAYENEFREDKFESTLKRLAADAQGYLVGKYERETARMLANAFKRASVVKDVTNGE